MAKQVFEAPPSQPAPVEEAAMPPAQNQGSARAKSVKASREAEIMAIEGVEGVGVTRDPIGNEAIVVYVRDSTVAKSLPKTLDGLPVQVQVTGAVDALRR